MMVLRRFLLLPLLLGVSACSSLPSFSDVSAAFQPDPGRTLSAAPLPLPAASAASSASDPVAAFAASAAPGQSGAAGGQPARLARVFHAASGRQCREVILGAGFNERAQIVCQDPDGAFRSARPLLQGAPR
ncbi:hypothetical protein [Sabulicella glaciei]|uniref:Uncharacterized protein n=1 Tax=Sabulicella glaciei TaxID=2984948 RepID=A0ABT3NUN8_9PROT|nr:hypothetical protein [Roseococcus sp. MDT2-1-1]MCW8085875.1 hypothetical protein [Roseococcus sp. MDT2-1-1]